MKHKSKLAPIEESISNINNILIQLKELIMLCDDDNFVNRLEALSDMIEYANPTGDKEIINYENKISNQLGDLKIMLTTRETRKQIDYKMQTIRLLITERNARA